MNVYQKYKDAALEWVNEVRDAQRLPTLAELPKGEPNNSRECVIARALSGTRDDGTVLEAVVALGYWLYRDDSIPVRAKHRHNLGRWVWEFIGAFDAGRYPELIA